MQGVPGVPWVYFRLNGEQSETRDGKIQFSFNPDQKDACIESLHLPCVALQAC